MKNEHKVRQNSNEYMLGWMCGLLVERKEKNQTTNKQRKKTEISELLGVLLQRNSLRLRWFEHVERKDDGDWVKCSMTSNIRSSKQDLVPPNRRDFVKYVKSFGPVPSGRTSRNIIIIINKQ